MKQCDRCQRSFDDDARNQQTHDGAAESPEHPYLALCAKALHNWRFMKRDNRRDRGKAQLEARTDQRLWPK